MRVGDDRPLVTGGGEQAPRPGVDAQRLGPAELDAATRRSGGGQLDHGRGDVAAEIVGLVYVAAFAPNAGESCFELSAVFPGSTLGDALQAVPRSDGTTDLTIVQDLVHEQFAADVPAPQAAKLAATQRPVTQEALVEPSGERPLWKDLPSWFVFGEEDRCIPKALQHYMARRAHAHRTIEIPGASHAVPVAHPGAPAGLIRQAAALYAGPRLTA